MQLADWVESADRVESAFLWNIADRVEYSGQEEELADLGKNIQLADRVESAFLWNIVDLSLIHI